MADPTPSVAASGVSATATTVVSFSSVSAGLLVLCVTADNYRTTSGADRPESTGFALVTGGNPLDGSGFHGSYMWYKLLAGAESSVSYTLAVTAPSTYALIHCPNISAFDVSNGQAANTTGLSYTTPTITPTTGRRLCIARMGFSRNITTPMTGMGTWLNSYTEISDTRTVPASGTQDAQGVATLFMDGNGSTTTSSGATVAGGTPSARSGIIAAFTVAATSATVTPKPKRNRVAVRRAANW